MIQVFTVRCTKKKDYKLKKLKPYTKMDKRNIKFDDTEIKEHKFHQNKSPILINDIDINKIVAPNKLPAGKQDIFTSCKGSYKIRPLCIFRPQVITYKRNFDEKRQIYLFMKNGKRFLLSLSRLQEKLENHQKQI